MANILVTGGNGQLGSELHKLTQSESSNNLFFTDIDQLDISDINALNKKFNLNKFELIINCAAYTAVDKAEEEQDLAFKINCLAVKNLVDISKKHKIKLIHISTDFVFNGNNSMPYTETDESDPLSAYAKSKFEGEKEALKLNESIILRTSWLYSSYGNNFVNYSYWIND